MKQTAETIDVRKALTSLWEHPHLGTSAAHHLERARNNFLGRRYQHLTEKPNDAQIIIARDSSEDQANRAIQHGTQSADWTILTLPKWSGNLVGWCWKQIAEQPADCVVLEGRSMALVITGLLYKLTWGAIVLVSQKKKPPLSGEQLDPITIDALKVQRQGLPDPGSITTQDWMALALDLIQRFDGETTVDMHDSMIKILQQPRKSVDGAQLNSLESLAPDLSSGLMAARFWRWNHTRIPWDHLREKRNPNIASIIIPAYGDSRDLDSCLHSIRKAHTSWSWEVIIVMNDDSEQNRRVSSFHCGENKRIRIIWPGENTQFALGCNLGFAASSGSKVVFLNNDCRVQSGWLDALLTPLSNCKVAATQPRLLKPDGSVQSKGVVFHDGQTIGYSLYAGLPGTMRCTEKVHRLQALTGACLAVRAKDFATVRGFDCRYLNSQEDIDLCLRLLQLEDRVFCLSTNSTVIHCGGKAPGRFGHTNWSRHQFARRWMEKIKADDQSVYANDEMEIEYFIQDQVELIEAGIGAGKARVRRRSTDVT